ncbi:MAG: 7-cyano-7-deazaguanine synthase QueC [Candidatus Saganbacteria bacterium]|nr:7-cyano-7-deazaguanine synthase QueC [Candidatus Saganbacteria bacterium]
MNKVKVVILLSGGLDSTTTLYYAKSKGHHCHALIFDYGQRHKRELRSAIAVVKRARVPCQIIKIRLPWKGSTLLDTRTRIPEPRTLKQIGQRIPSTYVPARNIIFLSFALSYAEAIGAKAIFIGANAVDYSGYPDCRQEFIKAFQKVVRTGTKAKQIKIETPLIEMSKAQIIALALKLRAPLELTWSCYKSGRKPCGRCDSCRLRRRGFAQLGLRDII